MPKFPPHEPDDSRHAFAETRCRYPRDMQLRAAGFVILSRPKTGEDVWLSPWGDELPFSQAVRRLPDVSLDASAANDSLDRDRAA